MKKTPLESSCSLCSGQGCVSQLFGRGKTSSQFLPVWTMVILFGLPLISLLLGGIIGSIYSEGASIAGSMLGLLCSGMILRACQSGLNRLSFRSVSGDHSS